MSCQGEKFIYFWPNTNLLIAHLLATILDKTYFKCSGNGELNLISKILILSKKILIDKIGSNKVECISEGKDRYKRTLAECFVNGESLSSYLVRSGYAFAYRKYSKKFIPDENYAKTNELGIWAMTFQYPWDFRKELWKNYF